MFSSCLPAIFTGYFQRKFLCMLFFMHGKQLLAFTFLTTLKY